MQKNLLKGLSRGATTPGAKTWPGTSELALLWLISHIWPTSDMDHPVVSPARILMGSYLGLCRIRNLQDLSSSLFLCTLFLRYEEYSKRLVPEVINAILNAIIHLCPHKWKNLDKLPGAFPCPDFNADHYQQLKVNRKASAHLQPGSPNLLDAMGEDIEDVDKVKVDLLAASLELLGKFADMYKSLDGSIELFSPASEILDGVDMKWASDALQVSDRNLFSKLSLMLFSSQSAILLPTCYTDFSNSQKPSDGRSRCRHTNQYLSPLTYQSSTLVHRAISIEMIQIANVQQHQNYAISTSRSVKGQFGNLGKTLALCLL